MSAMPKQSVETVPIKDVQQRIRDLNQMGVTVLSLSVDRERDQVWLLVQSPN